MNEQNDNQGFHRYPFGDGVERVLDEAARSEPSAMLDVEREEANRSAINAAFASGRSAEKLDVLAIVRRQERMHTSAASTAVNSDHRIRAEAKAATLRALYAHIFRDAHAGAAKWEGRSVDPDGSALLKLATDELAALHASGVRAVADAYERGRKEATEDAIGHLRLHGHQHAANMIDRREGEARAKRAGSGS